MDAIVQAEINHKHTHTYKYICECLCVYCPLSVPIFTKYYSRPFVSNNPYKFDLALSSPAKLSSFRYFSINK